jgi:hypothetical protein
MRDNLRPYRAIRDAVIQGYPGEPAEQDGLEGRSVDAATRCRREGMSIRMGGTPMGGRHHIRGGPQIHHRILRRLPLPTASQTISPSTMP